MTEREVLEVDALFVGAGPAGLAGAIRLAQILKEKDRDATVAVMEKAKEIGAHALSGAVMDPKALRELIPDFEAQGAPIEGVVEDDFIYFLTEHDCMILPVAPKPLQNHGNLILSLARLVPWLAGIAEKNGVEIFTGFAGTQLLIENDAVVGVRTGDKGVNKRGEPKVNYEPGVDIRAKVTVLCEGPRGTLTRELVQKFKLDAGRNPQVYATGVKEIWEFPDGYVHQKRVIHTMGWPLKDDTFGGGFVYSMSRNRLCIGFVVGLDYPDPFLDPHHELQRFKTHPKIRTLLDGGKMVEYGAKTIPEGGWYSIPKLYAPGCLLAGDSAGLLDAMRLKGIHMALKSGMLAAETIGTAFEKNDFSEEALAPYEKNVREGWIGKELYRSRNFKFGFKYGFWAGILNAAIAEVANGWSFTDGMKLEPGHKRMKTIRGYYGSTDAKPRRITFDEKLTFRKTTDVYYSGTIHDEDQPCHLIVPDSDVCVNRCTVEYGNPCQHFCPANVYEWITENDSKGHLQINAANCVHCKTCDIMDPYANITWVPPEGGGGPHYKNL